MITGTNNAQASTTRSSHNYQGNSSSLSGKNTTGQENRRPLLHRVFGGKQITATGQTQQSNSVGAVQRGVTGSFLSGGSNQMLSEIITTPQQAALFASSQNHKSMGGITTKDGAARSQLGRMPNQAITSAAPASHPPLTLDQKLVDTSTITSQVVAGQTKTQAQASSTERSGVPLQNRSISRARQFGKDLTTMFSFNRQPSRQSTNTATSVAASQQATQQLRHNKGASSVAQSVIQSARHHEQQQNQPQDYPQQQLRENSILPPATMVSNNQARKSSLNPTNSQAQNQLQKSLNSIEFQQQKGQSKSVTRDGLIRSREKLPEIGLGTKIAMYQQRVEKHVFGNIQKVDKYTLTDIYHVSEYCAEIQHHMQTSERDSQPDPSYMKRQPQVNENVRAILVDWLLSVHGKFKLLPETLFVTINLIDRFMSIQRIEKDQVQLLGITALLIASKYEEIYPPTLKDFIFVTKNVYNRQQILDMEMQILFNLEFQITETSSYRFLERYSKIAKADTFVFYLAHYLLELALLDSKMNQYPPSLQASAALYVAMRTIVSDGVNRSGQESNQNVVSCWTKALQEQTKYTSACLKSCSKNYFQLADLIQKSELQTILKKFMQPKYLEVARIICNVINHQNVQEKQQQQQQKLLRYETKYQPTHTGSAHQGANSCDKSTRGGSSTKQVVMSTPSQFNSSAKHITSKSAVLQQMTSGGTGASSADSKKQ